MAISPLLNAIRLGDLDTAKKILQKKQCRTDSQRPNSDGGALFWACCRGYLEVVQMLLMRGYNVNEKTSWNVTPICAAADNNHLEIVRLLLNYGAEVNCQTQSGDTACHLASYRGYYQVVILLVTSGADLFVKNCKRQMASDVASNQGHGMIAEYLKRAMDEKRLCRSNSLPLRLKSGQTKDTSGKYKNGTYFEEKRTSSSENLESTFTRKKLAKETKTHDGESCNLNNTSSSDYASLQMSTSSGTSRFPSYFYSSSVDDWSNLCERSISSCSENRFSSMDCQISASSSHLVGNNNLSLSGSHTCTSDSYLMTFKNIT